ncbi:MAG: hypothetical protein RL020_2117, partial [Pseudomonadota bacterium]
MQEFGNYRAYGMNGIVARKSLLLQAFDSPATWPVTHSNLILNHYVKCGVALQVRRFDSIKNVEILCQAKSF